MNIYMEMSDQTVCVLHPTRIILNASIHSLFNRISLYWHDFQLSTTISRTTRVGALRWTLPWKTWSFRKCFIRNWALSNQRERACWHHFRLHPGLFYEIETNEVKTLFSIILSVLFSLKACFIPFLYQRSRMGLFNFRWINEPPIFVSYYWFLLRSRISIH